MIVNNEIINDDSYSFKSNSHDTFDGNLNINGEMFIIRDANLNELLKPNDTNEDTVLLRLFGGKKKRKYNKSSKIKKKRKFTRKRF